MSPAALGSAAVAASMVLLILQIVLALPHTKTTSTRVAAIISALLEAAALLLLSWLLFISIRRDSSRRVTGLLFGSGVGLCVVSAALTVATLICLSTGHSLGRDTSGFLAGAAIVLVVSFVLQLLFLAVTFIADRAQLNERSSTPGMQEIGRPHASRVKTVPYERTTPPPEPPSRTHSMVSRSSGGFSATDTIASTVRSISSKTRLLSSNRSLRSQRSQRSQRSARHASSLESIGHRDRSSANDDTFDSWDTSHVDPQNRQTVLESFSPIAEGRFLETIPASPTTSRSPSPGSPLDLEPPRAQRRSRSFSPASTRTQLPKPPQRAFTQHTSASESHIHPLFRSDSPTPPPLASPGTVVIAAPQAGQVISDRQSIRSLSRLRSGSLPTRSSPLTVDGNGSFESFPAVHGGGGNSLSMASDGSEEGSEGDREMPPPERKVTPPIPEYILNAGSQTSLHKYQARKTPSRDGPSGPGLDALPPAGTAW